MRPATTPKATMRSPHALAALNPAAAKAAALAAVRRADEPAGTGDDYSALLVVALNSAAAAVAPTALAAQSARSESEDPS